MARGSWLIAAAGGFSPHLSPVLILNPQSAISSLITLGLTYVSSPLVHSSLSPPYTPPRLSRVVIFPWQKAMIGVFTGPPPFIFLNFVALHDK
jgi:hypothetical protein